MIIIIIIITTAPPKTNRILYKKKTTNSTNTNNFYMRIFTTKTTKTTTTTTISNIKTTTTKRKNNNNNNNNNMNHNHNINNNNNNNINRTSTTAILSFSFFRYLFFLKLIVYYYLLTLSIVLIPVVVVTSYNSSPTTTTTRQQNKYGMSLNGFKNDKMFKMMMTTTRRTTTTPTPFIPTTTTSYSFCHRRRTTTTSILRLQKERRQMSLFLQGSTKNDDDNDVPDELIYGTNMDQTELMESDELIAVDENDQLIKKIMTTTKTTDHNNNNQKDRNNNRMFYHTVSKRIGHTFSITTPRAILHRAFSFFLFNEQNELLLTQRAASKITFPNVWTNTVCSHPLYNMIPNEVDNNMMMIPMDMDNDDPTINNNIIDCPGIKYAAIRKCQHELGIPLHCIQHNEIQFITRYHYWAADTMTYGTNTKWGEHEIDYLLFYKWKNSTTTTQPQSKPILKDLIQPVDDEVAQYKFVSQEQLREMIANKNNLWSPWFLGILENGGWEYWTHLDTKTLHGQYTNTNITYFDPPIEHYASYNLPTHTRQTGILDATTTTTTTSTETTTPVTVP